MKHKNKISGSLFLLILIAGCAVNTPAPSVPPNSTPTVQHVIQSQHAPTATPNIATAAPSSTPEMVEYPLGIGTPMPRRPIRLDAGNPDDLQELASWDLQLERLQSLVGLELLAGALCDSNQRCRNRKRIFTRRSIYGCCYGSRSSRDTKFGRRDCNRCPG